MSERAKEIILDLCIGLSVFNLGWDVGQYVDHRHAPASDATATVEAAELHLAQRLERVEQTVYRIEHDTAVLRSVRRP